MLRKTTYILVAATILFFITTHVALAWPGQPPVRATISGSGLEGEVEITEPEVLQRLRLGGIEDFNYNVVDLPKNLGVGYKITRYFYENFNFATLTYYPYTPRSLLYFEDGPQLEGDHTMYNQQWLYATPAGDQALRGWLAKHGVSLTEDGAMTSQNTLPANSGSINSISSWLIVLEASVAVAIGLAGGLLFWRWKRAR
jgi:hypothetical protein